METFTKKSDSNSEQYSLNINKMEEIKYLFTYNRASTEHS